MCSSLILLLLLCCIYLFSAAAAIFDGHDVFEHQVVNERRLLQVQAPKKPCPYTSEYLNMLNYTIIKSECKGPEYPQEQCCNGFKKFVCPFVDYINDNTTKCGEDIIGALETNGKYPDNLFFRLCRDGKDGILCPAPPPSPPVLDQNAVADPSLFFMLQLFTLLACCLFFSPV